MNVENFPLINAILNGIATLFLVAAGVAIYRKRDEKLHRNLMLGALAASALFLACYLYYHYHAGSVRYLGGGVLRYIYFFILATHIPLAGLMVPFILWAVYAGFAGRRRGHTIVTRWLYPVWLYVSVTGVLIYLMLYPMGGSVG
jgi:putative membrane protein